MAYTQNNPFSRRASSPLNQKQMSETRRKLLASGQIDEKSGEPMSWSNPASLQLYAHNRASSLGFDYGSSEYSDIQNEAARLAIRKRAINKGQNLTDYNIANNTYPSRGRLHSNIDWTASSDEEKTRRKYFGDFGDPYESL